MQLLRGETTDSEQKVFYNNLGCKAIGLLLFVCEKGGYVRRAIFEVVMSFI